MVFFDDCKLFRDVAHTRSLSKAASLNEISQPAATQRIHDMERRAGTSLLDRSTRPLGLTAAGRIFADMCRDVLRREEDFTAQLDDLVESLEGTVRVASIYSIGLSEMTRLREEFQHLFPKATL